MKTKKLTFYTEIAYFVGLFFLAFGTALTVYGGFGISMVVAPAYILHLFVSQFLPFFSFGMAEYTLQAVILVILSIILRKAKWSYLLSFVAAILYGLALDLSTKLTAFFPQLLPLRIIVYLIGVIIICAAVALLFSAYLPPEAYEMFVKEFSAKFKKPIPKVKMIYDCASLVVAIILCIILLSPFKADSFLGVINNFMACGISIGTVTCAFINGPIIGLFQRLYSKIFNFKDGLKLRKYFEDTPKS
jgi:uncharacterized membrane protein YczE